MNTGREGERERERESFTDTRMCCSGLIICWCCAIISSPKDLVAF
jgi:hypothetical protein